jgi:hypothetical protein
MSGGNMSKYRVIGRTKEGKTLYYTGRAGQFFVNPEPQSAFWYDSLEAARRRATNLNVGTLIHGIRFFVPCGEYPEAA